MPITENKLTKFVSNAEYRREIIEGPIRKAIGKKREEMGYAPYPQYITLYLTNQCNLRCKMCAQWGENGANFSQPKLFMDMDDIKKLYDEIAFFHPTIVIMGGEPMLNQDWMNVIRLAHERDIPTAMITNGMFLEKHAETLVESGLTNLNISIDGPQPIHDMIRKSPGGYNKIMAGLDAVNRVKTRTGKQNPSVTAYFTITGMNYQYMSELADNLVGKGVDLLRIQHLWFELEETYNAHNEQFTPFFGSESACYNGFVYDPGKIDSGILLEQLNNLRKGNRGFQVSINPAHPDGVLKEYYSNTHFERKVLRDCQAIWNSVTIGPQGEVQPCLDYYCGNIRTDKLLDIWNGKKLRYFRRVRKEHGPFPLCHRCCA